MIRPEGGMFWGFLEGLASQCYLRKHKETVVLNSLFFFSALSLHAP